MYQSKKQISSENLKQLKSDLDLILRQRKMVYCKALKRSVSPAKLPGAITNRRNAKKCLRCPGVSVDILKNSSCCKKKIINKLSHYEIQGKDASGLTISIHLREETHQKDRKLFFISCYQST